MNNEFQSVNFHRTQFLPFECLLVLGIGAAFWCAGRKQFGAAGSILLWAHWSLQCGRNIPIFLLISAPLAACMTKDLLVRVGKLRRFQGAGCIAANPSSGFQLLERSPRLHLVSLAALVVIAAGFVWEKPGFETQFNPKSFPVQALSFIKTAKFSRLFTTDQWADYLVYHLYPSQRTYLDGRSDMFGADFLERYGHIMQARYDWETNLRADAVDAVMLRPDVPVVSALKQSKNWKLLFDNGSVVIFQAVPVTQALKSSILESTQVSPVIQGGRKRLGYSFPSARLNSTIKSQERRS